MSVETPLLPTPDSVFAIRRRRKRFDGRKLFRLALPASVVTLFLLFFLTVGIIDEAGSWKKQPVFPDFSHYRYLDTLPSTHFPNRPDDGRRVFAVGDIHGMNQSLTALLDKISYDSGRDTLIHLGDLVSKKKKVPSEAVLSFMSTNHILGIRGNNDQVVIEWRTWMVWIMTLPGGKEWLEDMDSKWAHIDGDESNPEFNAWLKKSHEKWQPYVPKGWKLLSKHYKTARSMPQEHYDYLRSLPLILYAPTAHTYFVHAGLLAADPTLKITDPKQPLSHLPTTANPNEDVSVLRGLQELALLNEVPQNQDAWMVMNVRSLTKKNKPTDGKKGTPWSDLWNDVMDSCSGFSRKELTPNLPEHSLKTHTPLECFPSMVVYGHAAARDLDVKRWSVGLDTGCAYGRRLTAVVLDASSVLSHTRSQSIDVPSSDSLIPYGDEGTAQIVSVNCGA